jgi:hypothetical protein
VTRGCLLAAVLSTASCYHSASYGHGECREYHPLCLGSNERCTRDNRGCEMCTCDEKPAGAEPSRGQPDPEPGVY